MRLFVLSIVMFFKTVAINAQCVTYTSSCGYAVSIEVTPLSIIPSSTNCPSGYNYNVRFGYKIVVAGTNSCYNGSIGIQPQIICNADNNGYYTITIPAPNVGSASTSTSYTGTLTTSTNPYRNTTNCKTATPTSLGCNGLVVNMFGPNLNASSSSACLVTLPIELASFKSLCDNKNTLLTWVTHSELNNNYFIIEKSTDAFNWQELKKINGAGNSNKQITYSFIDNDNTQDDLSYYRLKQMDFDGTGSYSKIISSTNCNSNGVFYYNNYSKQIVYRGLAQTNAVLHLYNNMGQQVLKEKLESTFLDVDFLTNGIYYITVETANEIISKKILVTE